MSTYHQAKQHLLHLHPNKISLLPNNQPMSCSHLETGLIHVSFPLENLHELSVLARIVTTTLRSPLASAKSRISTAARLLSGTELYTVGGGM